MTESSIRELTDRVSVAVRCFPSPGKQSRGINNKKPKSKRPALMLVIDAETATENTKSMPGFDSEAWNPFAQTLLFGTARLYWYLDGEWKPVTEFTFYPSYLPEYGKELLRKIVHQQTVTRDSTTYLRDEPEVEHRLITLDEFIQRFYEVAYYQQGLVVGFNLPYDLSRLACGWSKARSKLYKGGFLLQLTDSPYRPKIAIRNLDSKRAFIGFTGFKDHNAKKTFRGCFLDIRTFVFAMTSQAVTLKKACEMYNIKHKKLAVEEHGIITAEYVEYNRRDVTATAELAIELLQRFDKHPISHEYQGERKSKRLIAENKVYSPASMAKAYLHGMGLRVPSVEPEYQGFAMAAYYGGRTEVKIRKAEVPVAYLDFRSMYPTVNCLMGLWHHVKASRIDIQDVTAEVQDFLDNVTFDELFIRDTWTRMSVIVLLQPDGEILPVRARYSLQGSWKIGINPYFSDTPQYYALADVIASKLLSGKTPKIIKAFRYIPVGIQKGLCALRSAGITEVNPAKDDFFAKLTEERVKVKKAIEPYDRLSNPEREDLQLALKILVNSGSYGIFAEMNPTGDKKAISSIYGNSGIFDCDTDKLEKPGDFSMAHMAALIPAGARLMLALLEKCVGDRGGVHVFTDTDSMAVVSTKEGSTITITARQHDQTTEQQVRALSWQDIDDIAGKFESLNPFDPQVVQGSILELKDHNFDDSDNRLQLYAYAISPKRYVMYGEDREPITDIQSSLGYLLNPSAEEKGDWIQDFWGVIAHGGNVDSLPFSSKPAVRKIGITSPEILERFKRFNADKTYAEQIKPFNFMLALSENSFFKIGANTISLIAPYEPSPERWYDMEWLDYHTNESVHLVKYDDWLACGERDHSVYPTTFCHLLSQYIRRAEPDFLAFDGTVCEEDTTGVLERRPVRALSLTHIGKEMDEIKNTLADVGLDDCSPIQYGADEVFWADMVIPVLKLLPKKEVSDRFHISMRTIERWICRDVIPNAKCMASTLLRLDRVVAEKIMDLGSIPEDFTSNISVFPRLLANRVDVVQESLISLVMNNGQRRTAIMLNMPQATLRKYLAGGLPCNIERILSVQKDISKLLNS